MVQSPIQAVQNQIVSHAHSGLATHVVSSRRKKLALVIAGIADLAQLLFFPFFAEGAVSPFDDVLDVVVAVALVAVLGWKWRLVLALAIELVPGVALFPSWTAVVASLPAVDVTTPPAPSTEIAPAAKADKQLPPANPQR